MESYNGKSILDGVAIGKIYYYFKEETRIKREQIKNPEAEIARFKAAQAQAITELDSLYEKALKEVGEANAAIFEVHVMMLEDEDYGESVEKLILTQKSNAEYAVAMTSEHFSKIFSDMEDDYLRARAIDIQDISKRVVNILSGNTSASNLGEEPVILVAKDLAPSETVQMDKSKLLGFVTQLGSPLSHTAILARTMHIPALMGIPIKEEWDGKLAIIDGHTGSFVIDPDKETLQKMRKRQQEDQERSQLLQQLKGKETITLDGKSIKLYANIGSLSDMAAVLANDAAGIGLFRSEFLYLEKDHYPTEEEQFEVYRTVAEKMAGKKVIIRTLDIGADKKVDYFNLDQEENPAMGYRAIRICLDRIDVFKTQLRAIYRASAYGNIAIMYPMIIAVAEVKQIRTIVSEIKRELKEAGIQYGEVKQGLMIETPAAVMESDVLAKEVDFLSIGTNDLTQYTLAIDRQNPKLDTLYDAHHPAILKMIQMVVNNGHKEGCWVGICGELGADTTLTETFLKMGVDELSVPPSCVLGLRKVIRDIKISSL